MFRERVAVALLFLPIFFWIIAQGGWVYVAVVALALGLAAHEYVALFRHHGHRPAGPLIVLGVVSLAAARFFTQFDGGPAILTAAALICLTWHLFDYERGAARSGTDFAISLAGIVYLGWIGAFLISLRQLPQGEWWLLTALPVVWIADSAAYMVGKAIGRRRLSPRLSPKKTWEGYLAGILAAGAGGAGLASLWGMAADTSAFRASAGLWLGLALGALTPLGDLGISMIKREVQVKDTGRLLPGHGGALDRLDSWLWAGVLGYCAATVAVR